MATAAGRLEGALDGPGAGTPVLADPEVTFISAVDATGSVAATSFGSWQYAGLTNPATYSSAYAWATKWGASTPGAPGGTVYYYFDPPSNWTPTEQAGLASGLALWSDEVNIQFAQTTDPSRANLTFFRGGSGAFTQLPHETPSVIGSPAQGAPGANAYISIATSTYGFGDIGGDFSYAGGYAYQTLIHEEGHLLGLGHAGPYNFIADPRTQQFGPYDSRLWSVMSYIDPQDTTAAYYASYPVTGTSWNGNVATTPQILDILAAQRLYGAATGGPLAAGGVRFGFNSNVSGGAARYFDFTFNTTPVVTLWAGGTGNTLDLSGFSQGAVIDLNPDTFSSAGGLVNNIGIADGVAINAAIGGSGDDVFILNDNLSSIVTGGGGIDMFRASLAGWQQSTITDLSSLDTINFTDATADLTYDWRGDLLGFSNGPAPGQAMTLANNPVGHLVSSVDPAGGVDLTLANQDPGLNDFGGDGRSDILWQDTSGLVVQWQMNDRSLVAGTAIAADPAWVPLQQGRGDFNGDHQSDILYRNSGSGQVVEWDMNGARAISTGFVGGDLNWSVVGTGDFNGDGKTDILWRNTNGALLQWQMNDRSVAASTVIGLDPGWTVVGTGDFNGDGKTDILQRSADTGQVLEWDMNGGSVTSAGFIGGDLNWSIAGIGDFNGDGKSDVLWRNSDGALVAWEMNDRSVIASAVIGLDPGWTVVGTGDFSDNGSSDILQRNTATGQVLEWDMKATTVVSGGIIGGDQNWRVATV